MNKQKKQLDDFIKLFRLAVPTGFEPAISALTGPHVWPLHHGTSFPNERLSAIPLYGTSGREFTMQIPTCQYY